MGFERLHVRSGVSEVKLSPSVKLDDYRIRLSTDVGNVKYGSTEYKGVYEEEGEPGKVLEIRNGTGDVLVSK